MPPGFRSFRILCATTPELEEARDTYQSASAAYSESVLLPEGILFASATFRQPFEAASSREAVRANIRMCDFFAGIFGDSEADAAYRGFVGYAIECAADARYPMRRPVVFFADPPGAMAEFRESLLSRCDVHSYSTQDGLREGLTAMFAAWRVEVLASSEPLQS